MRTLLLVPADELASAMTAGADAVIADLPEDAGPIVVDRVREVLSAVAENERRPLVFIRIEAVDTSATDATLAALMPAEPDGFVIRRCSGAADVQHLGAKLAVHEAERHLADGQTAIIAEIGAAAHSVMALDRFVGCSPRLLALAWNPGAFAAELELDDVHSAPCVTARSLVVIAATAATISAIEYDAENDDENLNNASIRARRDGFNGKVARTPAQLSIVEAAFGY